MGKPILPPLLRCNPGNHDLLFMYVHMFVQRYVFLIQTRLYITVQ